MKYHIIAAGKPALAYAKTGIAEYLKRLTRYGQFKLTYIKAADSTSTSAELLRRSEGTTRIVMDERGEQPNTAQFVKKINRWELDGGIKTLSLLIGASDGHTEEPLPSPINTNWLSSSFLNNSTALKLSNAANPTTDNSSFLLDRNSLIYQITP